MRTVLDALRSPIAIARMPARTWIVFAVYLALCSLVLGGVAFIIIAYREDARQWLIEFLFPESWTFVVQYLLDRFFENQQRDVLINAVVSGGLLLVTMSLFIVKEMVSHSFEVHGKLTSEPQSEFPLWEQAWEEIKLFLLFIAVQSSIFWLGYHPGEWRDILATAFSYLFLAATFAIDFISPVFQRHDGYYSQILKTLARRPVTSLAFGALFAIPPTLVGTVWEHHPEWSFKTAVIVLFGANIVGIAWATVSGTWLGARMLPVFKATRRSHPITRVVAVVVVVGTLGFNGYRFGAIGTSLYHKTQILKCDYDVVWSSFGFDTPSITSMIRDRRAGATVHFDVAITNDTGIDVELEDNRLVVAHKGDEVATARLAPMRVPDGETVTQTVQFSLSISPLELAKGRALFEKQAWTITLYLEVADGFEFPVYLVHPEGN